MQPGHGFRREVRRCSVATDDCRRHGETGLLRRKMPAIGRIRANKAPGANAHWIRSLHRSLRSEIIHVPRCTQKYSLWLARVTCQRRNRALPKHCVFAHSARPPAPETAMPQDAFVPPGSRREQCRRDAVRPTAANEMCACLVEVRATEVRIVAQQSARFQFADETACSEAVIGASAA